MTEDNIERIGKLADRIDNIATGLCLPGISPAIHLAVLRVSLPEIRDELREVVRSESGEDPWGTHPPELRSEQ